MHNSEYFQVKERSRKYASLQVGEIESVDI